MKAQLYSSFYLGARWKLVVNATPRPLYPRERPGTHCIGGWVGPRAGLDGCGKSRPTGIRSPDRPGHSESLYRPRYQKYRGLRPGNLNCPCGLSRPLHRLRKQCFRYVFTTPRKLGHDMDDMIVWIVRKESWKWCQRRKQQALKAELDTGFFLTRRWFGTPE